MATRNHAERDRFGEWRNFHGVPPCRFGRAHHRWVPERTVGGTFSVRHVSECAWCQIERVRYADPRDYDQNSPPPRARRVVAYYAAASDSVAGRW